MYQSELISFIFIAHEMMEFKRYTGSTLPARLYWGYMGQAHPY
jgi:hypothetical protein